MQNIFWVHIYFLFEMYLKVLGIIRALSLLFTIFTDITPKTSNHTAFDFVLTCRQSLNLQEYGEYSA